MAICLWVERRTHTEFDARHLEEVTPDMTGEHGVAIADDRRRKPVKPDNTIEEGASDGGGRVGMAEGDEVCILGELVDDGEDDGFAANLQKPFDEVHRDIRPHLGRNIERLEQPRRL